MNSNKESSGYCWRQWRERWYWESLPNRSTRRKLPASTTETPEEETAAATEAAETAAVETAADPVAELASQMKVGMDTVWVLVTGMLVFFMNLGFACVESGMCRAKNAVNILSKNFIVFAVTTIFFWALGWGIMFGNGTPYYGQEGLWFLGGADNSPATGDAYSGAYSSIAWAGVPLNAKFFFQLVFAGTAATIVSGAVAERIKYLSFIVFSAFMAIVNLPGRWSLDLGRRLARCWRLPRFRRLHPGALDRWLGCFGRRLYAWPAYRQVRCRWQATRHPRPQHDGRHHRLLDPVARLVRLQSGQHDGRDAGSDFAHLRDDQYGRCHGDADCDRDLLALARQAGHRHDAQRLPGWPGGHHRGLCIRERHFRRPSSVRSPVCWLCSPLIFFDRIKADDPVGATSVHLVCGVFGTICVGLFAEKAYLNDMMALTNTPGLFFGGGTTQLMLQFKGILATAAYVIVASVICWGIIKATMGMRVSREEEIEGLDVGEHGNEAYHGFVLAPCRRLIDANSFA